MKKSPLYQPTFAVLCCIAILFVGFLISCSKTNLPITRSTFAMGTPLTIQVFKGGGTKPIDDAFAAAVRIETLMSTSTKDYDSTELLDINKQSRARTKSIAPALYALSPETAAVLKISAEVSLETGGAFDNTIAPLIHLWGFGANKQHVPTDERIQELLPLVHWKTARVIHSDSGQFLLQLAPGQEVDVGGIAKGYAADTAVTILRDGGVTHALIDFGGNIRTMGATKPDGEQWRIGIQAPFGDIGTAVGAVSVGETSVVTTGVYERFFEKNGIRYFHVLNPKNGYPARNGLLSVSIIENNLNQYSGARADGLSTGVFVLGLIQGMALVERTAGIEAVFVTDEKTVYISSGLVESFELLSDDYRMGVGFEK